MDLLPSPGPHDTTTHLYSLEALQTYRPVCWINANAATNRSDSSKLQQHLQELPLQKHHLTQAIERWERLRPVLAHLFPLEAPNGRIQSPLRSTSTAFQEMLGLPSSCTLFIKEDSKLAVCGSVKARGGLYETLAFAETINDDWILDEESKISLLDAIQEGLMEDYQVVVGSTGNLGLSVGLVAAAMGMKSTIHMSQDAKQWKKDLLRERGSTVTEHVGSYGLAVEQGRQAAQKDANAHFVDDESSETLFLGYAAAALELKEQLVLKHEQKLVVYIPCGVGGAPSGICWGLKQVFGKQVTVLFAEPTHAPCVLLALGEATKDLRDSLLEESGGTANSAGNSADREQKEETKSTEKNRKKRLISCNDVGIDVVTEADGLACGTASPLCCQMVHQLCDGIFTVDDNMLFVRLAQLMRTEGDDAFMEPSCCAAMDGPRHLAWIAKHSETEEEKVFANGLLKDAVHVVWATGGSLVPAMERMNFIRRGEELLLLHQDRSR